MHPHRRLIVTCAFITAVSVSTGVRGEELPGIVDAAVVIEHEREAATTWRDQQKTVRAHAKALRRADPERYKYTDKQIDWLLEPAMIHGGALDLPGRRAAIPAKGRGEPLLYTLDDGTQIEFPWYRVGYAENALANNKEIDRVAGGASRRHETNKGGLRRHLGVNLDEVKSLALRMDVKLGATRDGLVGYAIRGAKGGVGAGRVVRFGSRYSDASGDDHGGRDLRREGSVVFVDPQSPVIDVQKMMTLLAEAHEASGGKVGPTFDIVAGDVGTKADAMEALAERGFGTPAAPSMGVSGKQVRYLDAARTQIDPKGGIAYRQSSTGDGAWMATRLAARRIGLKLRGAMVAVEGLGEVGLAYARSAAKDGARVFAIKEGFIVDGALKYGTLQHPLGQRAKPRQVKAWIEQVARARAEKSDINGIEALRAADGALPFYEGQAITDIKADIRGHHAMGGVLTAETVENAVRAGTYSGLRAISSEGANLAQTPDGAASLDRHVDAIYSQGGDVSNHGGVNVSNLEAAQNLFDEVVTSRRARRSLYGTTLSMFRRTEKLAHEHGLSERAAGERMSVASMVLRSLHLPNAPLASVEQRVISKARRAQRLPALRRQLQASRTRTSARATRGAAAPRATTHLTR